MKKKMIFKKAMISLAFTVSLVAFSKAYAPPPGGEQKEEKKTFTLVVRPVFPKSRAITTPATPFAVIPYTTTTTTTTRSEVTIDVDEGPAIPLKKKQEKPTHRLLIDLPSPLTPMLFDHKHLVIPHQRLVRQAFIDTQANPPVYAICYRGIPLNIAILETIHDLPYAAFPPHVVRCIRAIAQTNGSQLIEEITDGTFKPDAFFKDPRATLPPAMQAKYPQGWTSVLSERTRHKLFHFTKKIPVNMDVLNPEFILCKLDRICFKLRKKKDMRQTLDRSIGEIFDAHQRQRLPLEDEERRGEADSEQIFDEIKQASPDMGDESLDLLFDAQLNALNAVLKNFSPLAPCYRPTLDDLDFLDSVAINYLKGFYSAGLEDKRMDVRNTQLWKTTILPLLAKRAAAQRGTLFPPCLLMYGQGHNRGSYSILDKIMKLPGFTLRLLTREGWKEWTPNMQVIIDPAKLPDAHGRPPGHRHHGHPWPSSRLDDDHGRWPGHPNYGKSQSDADLAAEAQPKQNAVL